MSKPSAKELLDEMGWPKDRLDLIPPVENLAARVEKVLAEVNKPQPNAGACILSGLIRRILNGEEP